MTSVLASTSPQVLSSTISSSPDSLSSQHCTSSTNRIRKHLPVELQKKIRLQCKQLFVNLNKVRIPSSSTSSTNRYTHQDIDASETLISLPHAANPEPQPAVEPTIPNSFTFIEWLELKRNKLQRWHYVIGDEQHQLLLYLLRVSELHVGAASSQFHHSPALDAPPAIILDEKEKTWAENLVSSLGLRAIKVKTTDEQERDTIKYLLVKPKVVLPDEFTLAESTPEANILKFYYILPKASEIPNILLSAHTNSGHAGYKELYNRIKSNYLYVTREMCKEFKLRCCVCNRKSVVQRKGHQPINPIDGKETFFHVQLDLIDKRLDPGGKDKQYKYIAHMIDHYSSFHITEALTEKSGEQILEFLRRAFSMIGYPQKLHTDNGSEFVNSIVSEYLKHHRIQFVHGKPYKPTTQGKVERANRTLKETMQKLVIQSKHKKNWYDVLFEATLACNTNLTKSINKSPYEHVFCMKPINDGNLGEAHKTHENVNMRSVDVQSESGSEFSDLVVSISSQSNDVISKRIRSDSDVNYRNNLKKMKLQHDRLRSIRKYSIGEVVAVPVPDAYKVTEANKLFAIVVGINQVADQELYTLAYDEYVIENKYYSHELRSTTGLQDYFGIVVQEEQKSYIEKMVNRHQQHASVPIPLQTAFNYFLNLSTLTTSENEEDVEMKQQSSKSTRNTGLCDESDETESDDHMNCDNISSSLHLKDSKCCVCEEETNDDEYDICGRCGCKMHISEKCRFGIMNYKYGSTIYCTQQCYLQSENYAIAITRENRAKKQYTIIYKNGDSFPISATKIESLAEYAKMLYEWRNVHPPSMELECDDDDVVILTSTFDDKQCENENDGSCCVCNEELTKDNPHTCYSCKKRMHGYLICRKKELIHRDDDKLYCNVCRCK